MIATSVGFGKMPRSGFCYTAGAVRTVRDLHCTVTVRGSGFDLGDTIVGHFQHSHRQRRTVIGKNAGHANLATDKS